MKTDEGGIGRMSERKRERESAPSVCVRKEMVAWIIAVVSGLVPSVYTALGFPSPLTSVNWVGMTDELSADLQTVFYQMKGNE